MTLKHTPALEAAVIAATNARDGQGRCVHLCNFMDPAAIAARIREMQGWLTPPNVLDDAVATAARRNIQLLSNLLREHIRAGNYAP